MAKDAYYFSHDSNARHDPKITAMRSVYGAEGYGWYWMLVEMMRESEGYTLDLKSKYVWNAYALQMQCDSSKAESYVHDCIHEFALFEADESSFWSPSLHRRMSIKDAISETKSKAAKARWNKEKSASNNNAKDTQSMHMHSTSIAHGMQVKESKVKESKVNKKKEDIKDMFISTEIEQHFESWWKSYPNKGSKKTALASFKKEKAYLDMDKLHKGTQQYITHQQKNRYNICMGSVFLNQRRWEGEWDVSGTTGRHYGGVENESSEDSEATKRIKERLSSPGVF